VQQNTQQSPHTEVRPYARARPPIGQMSLQDTAAGQSRTRAPAAADQSTVSNGAAPAVYVRGQKRKVSTSV